MATLLFVVAAASHSPAHNTFWYECRDASREACVSHVMPKHRGQHPFGFWQAKRAAKYVIYPYFKRQIHRVKPMVRQVTRAVRTTAQSYWYTVTGYAPPAACGASGATASGIMPYYGVAASTLPFGTRGYVPGYGPFVAEDTGGAIGPGRLDLYFPTCAQAMAWGVRRVLVSIY